MPDASSPPLNLLDIAPSLKTPGFRLVDAGEVYELMRAILGYVGTITAAGTTQATGTQLTAAGVSVITTAAAGSGAVLPPGLPGQMKNVVNVAANPVILYGSGGDQIIPLGSSTPAATLSVPAGATAQLVCVSKNMTTGVAVWKVVSLG